MANDNRLIVYENVPEPPQKIRRRLKVRTRVAKKPGKLSEALYNAILLRNNRGLISSVDSAISKYRRSY